MPIAFPSPLSRRLANDGYGFAMGGGRGAGGEARVVLLCRLPRGSIMNSANVKGENPMVDGKQVVAKAMEYVKAVYDSSQVVDLMLDEVERSEDGKHWFVTLGFTPREAGGTHERTFKVLKIVAETGEVLSMKIRKL